MAAKLTFRPTTLEDISVLARTMRAADVREVVAAGGHPEKSLLQGFNLSDACVTVVSPDDEILVIYGIVAGCKLTGLGRPWLLGSDAALKYKREFMTLPKLIIPKMLSLYPRLENYVHTRNRVSIRWLKLLGFKMDEPVEFPSGESFMRFYLREEDYV